MLFNSLQFLLFFPFVTACYFLTPHRGRWIVLLLASCYFYMVFIPVYLLILIVTIVIDYIAARVIESGRPNGRYLALLSSILSTCMVLFFFKYYDFMARNLSALAAFSGARWSIATLGLVLPIGLSFHTFQSLSYVIEVYRRRQRAERHFGIYALYVMFYPQLVAGPIERPQNLLHQFREHHSLQYQQVRDGLRYMLWGMFKKVVVADRLSLYVDAVYNHLSEHTGPTIVLATVLFAFQIYCDFSGYSDIAIGAAKVMGFDLMQNFNTPYFAVSIMDFWRRWHISLSTWFRDYVYVPLGGRRTSYLRWCMNILITFTISGLWHGANWTYVIWGALNGIYLILTAPWAERITRGSFRGRAALICSGILTFTLTCGAWVFFRAPSLKAAITAYRHIFGVPGPVFTGGLRDLIYGVGGIGIVITVDLWTAGQPFADALSAKPLALRWSLYLGLIIGLLAAGVFNASQFIYFQF